MLSRQELAQRGALFLTVIDSFPECEEAGEIKRMGYKTIKNLLALLAAGLIAYSCSAFNGYDLTSETQEEFATTEEEVRPPATQEIAIHFIDVGQGDSIYIKYPNGDDILVDGNGGEVVEYLKQVMDDDTLEIVVATHPDSDHISGLDEVFKEFKVKNYVDNGNSTKETQAYSNLEEAVEKEDGCQRTTGADGMVLDIGPNYIKTSIISPSPSFSSSDEENYSLVILIEYDDFELLLTGDIYAPAEEYLTENYKQDIDVLKVAHHGSEFSTSLDFLGAFSPEVAVISAGENEKKHPSKYALERLVNENIVVYVTNAVFQDNSVASKLLHDGCGTVRIFTDGKTRYQVESENCENRISELE